MSSGPAEVDGHSLEPGPDETILSAAQRLGIEIPTLCYLPGHPPDGGCRVCLVEVAGAPRPQAACHTLLRAGMRVATRGPALARLRATARELAEAQRGHGAPRTSHPYLRFAPELCITCRRCLHVCSDVQGADVYAIAGRGAEARLVFGADERFESSPCTSCGTCVAACPTGALSDVDGAQQGGEIRRVRSTCGYCGVGCQVEVVADERRVLQISGVPDASVNRGHLCAKGRYAHAWRESPERLTRPLARRGGELVPISWPEALELVARRLGEIHARHGPDAVGALTSSRSTNEAAYLLQKLFRTRFGTNNVDCCARVCHSSTALGFRQVVGVGAASACYDDIERARLIAVVGANPSEAHPVLGARILQAVRRGARLLVIDPRRIELADAAHVFVPLRAGSNVAVLNALCGLLLETGGIDAEYLARRTDGLEALRAAHLPAPLELAARASGVSAEVMRAAAAEIAAAGPTLFVSGLGTSELTQGTASARALANLALLSGSVGRPGAGLLPLRGQNNVQGNADMGGSPDLFPGYQSLSDPEVRARLSALWGSLPPETPGLTIPEMFEAARAGRLRALWIQGEDVAQSDPDQTRVFEALERLEFLVVQEIFPSETVRFAQLVLPAAGWLEQEGTFTNAERRIQRVRAAAPPPGEARADWQVIRDAANALRAGWDYPTPGSVMDEIARAAPHSFGGVSYARLEPDGLHWPCPSYSHSGSARLHETTFPAGRARLEPVAFVASPESEVPGFPYRLITGRVLHQYNVGTMTRRTDAARLAPADRLEIHPADAAREGIVDGAEVELESRWGRCRARAALSDRVSPGSLFLSFHFPETHANRVTGPARDPESDCPEYKLTAVRLRA
ncbi:MAG TPA: formate dehydrogenase subunit alpha [Myxococcota bacterium]|nr:formate dehydrogenase subunit alpha [Myxococcota bacterium]